MILSFFYPVGFISFGFMEPCYYVYVLISEKDNLFYTGYTKDLKNRLEEHQSGKVKSTALRLPIRLIYFEGCLNQQDATR